MKIFEKQEKVKQNFTHVTVKFSEEEYKLVKLAAKLSGMSISKYCLHAVKEALKGDSHDRVHIS